MDIQTSFNNQILQTMKSLVENNLNLKTGQQLVTKVIALDATGMTLKWNNQTLIVENQNPRAVLTSYVGQNITLQVSKTTPELEFKIIKLDSQFYENPPSAEKLNAMRLTLAIAPLAHRIDESMKQFSLHAQNQNPIEAKVIGLVGHKIQLELIVDDHQGGIGKKMLVTIEPNQLQLLPTQKNETLKVGQFLTLAITKIGATPEFKQLPTIISPSVVQEEKIAAFMKQLLPRHESPSVLFSQLTTDLPQLDIKNESFSQTLKQNASALFEHLPPNEQLFNPQKLRHLIYSSGIFYDANEQHESTLKSASPTQTSQTKNTTLPVDLKMPLLNLVQHINANNELKQAASNLLQNLLKKDAAPLPELAQLIEQNEIELHAQLLPLLRAENIPQSLKNLAYDILPNLKITQTIPTETEITSENVPVTDFKNDLFELMHTLKQGIAKHTELALTQTQVEGLQNLQHKTENALAKVVVDQLHSVPKEDSGKQVWAFELPFLMNQHVETLKMEIQRDKKMGAIDNTAQHWSVNLTLTPPNLGEVQCVISYQNGVISTYFKNEHLRTTNLITQHLENLKQQMQRVGLITGLMSSHNNFQPIKSAYSIGNISMLNETA